jgi:putative FmdB family regulatory protein
MPTYDYACAKCGEHAEVFQTFSEEPLKRHNQVDGIRCSGSLQKVFSPVGIVLKGSGFYKTDSRNASRAASKASETPSDSKSDTKTESKPDSKSDSKSSAKQSDSSSSSSSSSNGKKDSAKPVKKSA